MAIPKLTAVNKPNRRSFGYDLTRCAYDILWKKYRRRIGDWNWAMEQRVETWEIRIVCHDSDKNLIAVVEFDPAVMIHNDPDEVLKIAEQIADQVALSKAADPIRGEFGIGHIDRFTIYETDKLPKPVKKL